MVTVYLGLLEKKYADQLDEKAKQYMDFAVDGGLRAKDLVKDLLDFTRVDSQARPMTRTDMNGVLNNALSNLTVQINDEHASVTSDLLPTIMADNAQMMILLQNLISNAIKFHGDEAPIIHIGCEDMGDQFLFSVSDNGIGIDPAYKDKVFVMFQRLHTRDKYEGTGSVSRSLRRSSNGTVVGYGSNPRSAKERYSTSRYLRWKADENEAARDTNCRGQSRGCGHHQGDALGPEDRSERNDGRGRPRSDGPPEEEREA